MISNHGSFYFNQLAALQLIAGDKDGSAKTVQAYFNGLFKNQVAGNGDQVSDSGLYTEKIVTSVIAAS